MHTLPLLCPPREVLWHAILGRRFVASGGRRTGGEEEQDATREEHADEELRQSLRLAPEAAPLAKSEGALCDFWDGLLGRGGSGRVPRIS